MLKGLWRPAPYSPQKSPFGAGRALGQAPVVPGSVTLLDDPMLALAADVVAAGTSGYLAWGLYEKGSAWAPLLLVVTTAITVKALHDASRLKT